MDWQEVGQILCAHYIPSLEAARENLGSYIIPRNYRETLDITTYLTGNLDKLSQAQLKAIAMGENALQYPVLEQNHRRKG